MKKRLFIMAISVFCIFGFIGFTSACDDPPCVEVRGEPELDIETYAMTNRNFEPSCETLKTDKIGIHAVNVDGKGTENFDVEAEIQIYTLDEVEKNFCVDGADITVTGLDEQLTYLFAGTDYECKAMTLDVVNNRESDSEIKIGCIETATSSHQDIILNYSGPDEKLEFDIFNQTSYGHSVENGENVNQVYYRGLISGTKINP